MIYKVGYWVGRIVCGLDRALESFTDGFWSGRAYGEPTRPGTSIHEFAEAVSKIAPKGPAPATDPRSLLVTPEDKNRAV